jgi:hypothetical protein
MRERIFSKYKEFVTRSWDAVLLPKVAEMVAHAVLFEERKALTHDLDPEWDSSGMLEVHSEGRAFPLDYRRLSDFLDELTGESMPTHMSGCGLHYGAYRDRAGEIFTMPFAGMPPLN